MNSNASEEQKLPIIFLVLVKFVPIVRHYLYHHMLMSDRFFHKDTMVNQEEKEKRKNN